MTIKELAKQSPASQDEWEMWQLLLAMRDVLPKKGGVIVEIGVDGGGGLKTYEQAFPHATVIGIDNNIDKVDELKDFNMIFGDTTITSTVDRLKKMLNGRQIDFLFIDGDHRYEGVKNDFEKFSPLVRSGGAVGFHDTSRMGEGWLSKVEVRRYLEELWANQTYKCAEFWNGRNNPGTAVIWL